MTTEGFTTSTIVRHTHYYKLSAQRPADTMALAEADASGFINSNSNLSEEASLYSDTVIKVKADSTTGDMFAYWIQAGTESDPVQPSEADSTETNCLNLYLLNESQASSTIVRAALDKAEQDAKEYAEANDLEFNDEIVVLTHDGERLFVIWTTESED